VVCHDHSWQPPKPLLHQQHYPHKHSRATSATSRNQPVGATWQRGRDLKPSPKIIKSKLKVLYDHRESFEGKRRSKSSCIHSDGRRSRQQDARALEVCASALSCYSKQNPDNFLDRPVILEEDEGDTFAHTTDFEATSTSVNAGSVPAFERSQRADPPRIMVGRRGRRLRLRRLASTSVAGPRRFGIYTCPRPASLSPPLAWGIPGPDQATWR